jgi:hypothetical protein
VDYFGWSVARLDVNKSSQKTSGSLAHKIKEVMGSLQWDTVARACKWFRPRTEAKAMVAADGDFIELRHT